MNKIYIFILALTTLFVVSCERRPLLEISNTHYLRVYIDEEIKNVTCDYYNPYYKQPVYKAPDVMRVVLADPISGNVKAERYLRNKGKDEKGTYEGKTDNYITVIAKSDEDISGKFRNVKICKIKGGLAEGVIFE